MNEKNSLQTIEKITVSQTFLTTIYKINRQLGHGSKKVVIAMMFVIIGKKYHQKWLPEYNM